MILHQYNNSSYLGVKINDFWIAFKSDILKLTTKSWKEEDNRGSSLTHWKIMQYYNVLSLMILIYFDIEKNKTIYSEWSYYNTKYKLDEYRKCLACECIDLDKILTIFGFPFAECTEGIECMNIETTFIVESDSCEDDVVRATEVSVARVTEYGDVRTIN